MKWFAQTSNYVEQFVFNKRIRFMWASYIRSFFVGLAKVIVVASIGVLFSVPTSGFCYQPDPTLRCEFLNSDAVFIGTVISTRDEPARGNDDTDGWIYTLTVERLFRGPSSKTIEVYTENASARVPLTNGKQYLLFASRFHRRLKIVGCGNSALASGAKNSIQALEKIRIPKDALIEGRIGFGETPDADGHKPRMVVIVSGDGGTFRAVSGTDGWFHLHVPPGKYSAKVRKLRDLTAAPFDLSYDNPDPFVARAGHCSGLQFHAD
jgi:hypothetical protein